jgi:uncharacterized membrane protein YvbJ
MTLAICLKCGHEKSGALAVCPACGYEPGGDSVAQAKSLLLSDQHTMPDELHAAGAVIRSGGTPSFDQARLVSMLRELRRAPPPEKTTFGDSVVVWGVLVLVTVLVFVVARTYL